jgi:heterodisulfide reductase subunit C
MGHHDDASASDRTLAGRLERATGVRVSHCYQCGKCTAGCPVADEMDEPPSRLLRLLQTDRSAHERRALASRAIWLCLGCETCVSRCPNEVDVPRAIDHLRGEAVDQGLAHRDARDILAFHRAFLGTIGGRGRLYELELIARYKLATGHLLQDVSVAPAMFAKGKIGLLPHRTLDRGVGRVFEASRAAEARADRPHEAERGGGGNGSDPHRSGPAAGVSGRGPKGGAS